MENLPIDIHSNKLLDWLISRRHCPKNWGAQIETIRGKISHAIRDMPENEQILAILNTGQCINYFHCKQIVEILRETEKETKNIFGMYSSQRMKDWNEIISLYEKDNVGLAEAANLLQRFVQYEVPALRKQIAKAENTARESERKEQNYAKLATESRRAFERELAKWGMDEQKGRDRGTDLRRALIGAADILPLAQLGIEHELRSVLEYFEQFTKFVGTDIGPMFPFIHFLLSALNSENGEAKRSIGEVTVYEWRHGKKPTMVVARTLRTQETENNKEDEIDFGDEVDEAEIDFCTNGEDGGIEIVLEEEDGQRVSNIDSSPADDGIARGEEALPVLDHLHVRREFLDDLDQLISFLHFRLQDELAESAAAPYLAGIAQRPAEIGRVGAEELRGWLAALRQTATELGDPSRVQLLRIRTSPRFMDEIVAQLEQKRRLEAKYEQMEQAEGQKQKQCAEEIQKAQKLLEGMVEAAKGLQEELEKDLSKRYNGREVYIMGEINAVLYGS